MHDIKPLDRASLIERVSEHAALIAPIVASLVRKSNRRHLSWPDLTQAGFVGLLEACQDREYDPARSSFPTYVSRRIEWAVLHAIRIEHGGLRVIDALERAGLERVDPAPLPDSVYALREALGSLSARQRQAVELRLSGFTQALAASEMGISRVAVTNLQARARKRLREYRQPAARPVLQAA